MIAALNKHGYVVAHDGGLLVAEWYLNEAFETQGCFPVLAERNRT